MPKATYLRTIGAGVGAPAAFACATSWVFTGASHFLTSPDPTRHPALPTRDQPLPTTNPGGRGDESQRRSLRRPPILAPGSQAPTYTPQEDLLLTLDQTPMPKGLLSAIWCRYSSVLEAEKGWVVKGAGGPHGAGVLTKPQEVPASAPPHLSNIPHSLPSLGTP